MEYSLIKLYYKNADFESQNLIHKKSVFGGGEYAFKKGGGNQFLGSRYEKIANLLEEASSSTDLLYHYNMLWCNVQAVCGFVPTLVEVDLAKTLDNISNI